ncbi:MAG: hypothetical protein R3E79_23980 [Caldilineaceae bacterium]
MRPAAQRPVAHSTGNACALRTVAPIDPLLSLSIRGSRGVWPLSYFATLTPATLARRRSVD